MKSINLLPSRVLLWPAQKWLWVWSLSISALMALLLILAIDGFVAYSVRRVGRHKQQLLIQLMALKPEVQEGQSLNQQVTCLQRYAQLRAQLERDNKRVLTTLIELKQQLPPGVVIQRIKRRAHHLVIDGEAQSLSQIATLLHPWRASLNVAQLQLEGVKANGKTPQTSKKGFILQIVI